MATKQLASDLLNDAIIASLQPYFTQSSKIIVAYSGGRDSHVLLDAMVQLQKKYSFNLSALHINHGLHAESLAWQLHCEQVCQHYKSTCHTITLDLNIAKGESIEAAARHARYQAWADYLPKGSVLLLAQHQQDQAETLLLQLLRGAGVDGLAAMPAQAPLGQGMLMRPMLGVNVATVNEYSEVNALQWVEDPSNQDERFDRNYLRHQIFPKLSERWPATAANMARSAEHLQTAQSLLKQLAASDYQGVQGSLANTLSIQALSLLEKGACEQVLRYWIQDLAFKIPATVKIAEIMQMLVVRVDANPCVTWPGACVRRYRDNLFLDKPEVPMPADWQELLELPQPLPTDGSAPWQELLELPQSLPTDGSAPWQESLELPQSLGRLSFEQDGKGNVDVAKLLGYDVSVRFRRGGERYRLPGESFSRSLKHYFQEKGVPPWQRDRIPLLFVGEELVVVVGHLVCEAVYVVDGGASVVVSQRHPPREAWGLQRN